jgi:hypothetical protein
VNAIRKDLVRRKDSETTGQRWRVETGRPLYRTRRLRLNRSSAFDLLMRPLITLKMWLIVKEQVQACPRQRAPNLLLIEDQADLANVTAEFLRLLGLDIQIAGSGNQALKMARAFSAGEGSLRFIPPGHVRPGFVRIQRQDMLCLPYVQRRTSMSSKKILRARSICSCQSQSRMAT